jgi:hypothetical protein
LTSLQYLKLWITFFFFTYFLQALGCRFIPSLLWPMRKSFGALLPLPMTTPFNKFWCHQGCCQGHYWIEHYWCFWS